MFLLRADPSLNYRFISSVYFFFVILTVILYGLENYGEIIGWTLNIKGFWLVTAPSVPALIWAMVMSLSSSKVETKDKNA